MCFFVTEGAHAGLHWSFTRKAQICQDPNFMKQGTLAPSRPTRFENISVSSHFSIDGRSCSVAFARRMASLSLCANSVFFLLSSTRNGLVEQTSLAFGVSGCWACCSPNFRHTRTQNLCSVMYFRQMVVIPLHLRAEYFSGDFLICKALVSS